jgi:hypothetical protein
MIFHQEFDIWIALGLNRVNIPVFLFDGDRDWGWWLQMSAEYGSLKNLGKDVTWVRYRDEEHYFKKPEYIRDSLTRVVDFFRNISRTSSKSVATQRRLRLPQPGRTRRAPKVARFTPFPQNC